MKFENPQSTYLLYGDFQNTDLKIMYTHPKIKSLVTLTHGEGFGRPLLEPVFVVYQLLRQLVWTY